MFSLMLKKRAFSISSTESSIISYSGPKISLDEQNKRIQIQSKTIEFKKITIKNLLD
jgi:hypothetical protein